jgi:cytoskeletal protein RodZ
VAPAPPKVANDEVVGADAASAIAAPTASVVVVASASTSVSAPASATATAKAPKKHATPATPATAAAKPPDCDPPFVIDAENHKVYKRECLK